MTGTTPARWVECARVDAARELLEHTDASVALVARQVGFGSRHRMAEAFDRVLGISPPAYRRNHLASAFHRQAD